MTATESFWARRIAPLLRPQFVRFVLVGGANTSFNILVYWAFLWIGLAVPLASLASLVVGILINFTTQSRFVFDNRNPWKLLPYFVVWAILYVFNLGLIWLLMGCGLDAYLAGMLSTPTTVLLSYFLQKFFVFRRVQ
ncbi:GtrA family protein [Rudaea cellulosilytica]|uniref:GtrA family protein n=1 Tax=Rudaea cellulosilytica TaxID=540746 RepID=UPI000376016A|nr:GtrA family protein [Rudaea cellulosilytica]